MNTRDHAILELMARNAAQRRRLLRHGAIEAVRRGLAGQPATFRVAGTSVVVEVGDQPVASLDPWLEDECAHD